jgi:ArsR family transcriptional regulator, arsenate/arsenite/antimonite-responsive transcriptional repressor / arsenate reductase (thioredoxin)
VGALEDRAAVYAALGDPARLAIVDALSVSDRSPVELRRALDMESNLLAHHLDVLERVGLIERSRSSGDGRRRYVHLRLGALAPLGREPRVPVGRALFVCTANAARSQLAAALWRDLTGKPATSAGTHPAERTHPRAIAAARRAGLDLGDATPRHLDQVRSRPALVVTVCDRAHEALDPGPDWLHWSVPDPVSAGTTAAFDRAVDELRGRIAALTASGAVA